MVDFNSISAALASIKAATDIANFLRAGSSSLEKAETKMKVAELIGSLADTRVEIANIQEEMIQKDQMIAELKEFLNVKENLKWDPPYYWLENEGEKEGPFCQVCYDKDGKLIRLQSHERSEPGLWMCDACDNTYTDSRYNPSGATLTPRYR